MKSDKSKGSKLVPNLSIAEITTAGKGDEMLNILVNDSFSTTNSGKKKNKKGKKGGKKGKAVAEKMGFSALEILQMKDKETKKKLLPTAKPVVYFKDFEKRFDELLVRNKTPRKETISTISPRGTGVNKADDILESLK